MARQTKVELWKGGKGKWFFHRRGANGRISAPSQGYASRRGGRRAALRDLPGLPIVVLDRPPGL